MKFKNTVVSLLFYCSVILLGNRISAQSKNDSTVAEQKDVSDIVAKVFKRKISSVPDSIKVKPGKLLFAGLPGVGYSLVTGVTAVVSFNVSFFTGKRTNTYLSSVTSIPEVSLFNHQIIIPIQSNIWSKGNKYNWLGDWRYYKYPTYTYGLGGHSLLSDADMIDYSYFRVYQEVLKQIHSDFYAGLGYGLDYHLNITEQGTGDFQQYNKNATKTVSSGMSVRVLYDGRKNVNNPPKGFYGSITYRSNFTFLGSDQNWQSLLLDFRKYIKLSPHSDNVLALWSYNWLTFGGKPPYFDLPSTGWDTYSNIGRGYIQGRLRGTNLIYLESEYRFGITRNGLLGGVIFANAQTVSEIQTNKFETILPGGGIGLRFKVNKYSRANFCVDYGFGIEGPRGLFFNVCEVF
ncbi:MAG TPA: BamA/TamA family outer membrane protein [Bacteroidia bacterium]|nr:BamA/TamA family outer membrane protein [Bacteroidia bacterium]